jgi:CRISPR/Cas system endoribonuclease Cas6 (RAMP superfamily)
MAMKMRDVLAKTPESRRQNAAFVKIKNIRVQRTPYNTLKYLAQTYSTHDSKGDMKRGSPIVHQTMVETNGKQVVVDCDCEDHTFTWEVALNAKKAARIKNSNGEPPVVRNPKWRPGCCKHVFSLGRKLVQQGKVE